MRSNSLLLSGIAASAALAQENTTTINYASLIDLTSATSATAASSYSTSIVPTSTAPAHYIFTYGDSYTSNGFVIGGDKPVENNPLGNPSYPGTTSTGPGLANWLDVLTKTSPLNTLTYDFAYGGAVVNNAWTEGVNADIPDFFVQTAEFVDNIAPHPEYARWTAANSMFVVWFGRNDVYWKEIQDANRTRLDDALGSYLLALDALYNAGGRKFLILGIPPMWKEPLWTLKSFAVWAPPLQGDAAYWNENLQGNMTSFKDSHDGVTFTFFDPQPIFLNILSDPQKYGAPSALCTNSNQTMSNIGPSNGTDCLWADLVHPGEVISSAIGMAVSELLVSTNLTTSNLRKANSKTCADEIAAKRRLLRIQREVLEFSGRVLRVGGRIANGRDIDGSVVNELCRQPASREMVNVWYPAFIRDLTR